jgi:hypothetical protein
MTTPVSDVIDTERIVLKNGSHSKAKDGICVMELTSLLAGEPFSDRPECTSIVISTFLRVLGDELEDETRQLLKPYAERVIGTRTTSEDDHVRACLATDWLVRVCAPAWLYLAGLDEYADALKGLPPHKNDQHERPVPLVVMAPLYGANAAARAAATVATKYASWSDAWEAVVSVDTIATVHTVIRAAVRAANYGTDAERDISAKAAVTSLAAWGIARATACHAWYILPNPATVLPTTEASIEAIQNVSRSLLESAFGLLDQMIAVGRSER